jgi:predicted peroxiredoxin
MKDIYAGIIDKMIGNETKGVDHYNHNGSTWLIFTDEKKWVIEFTKEGTLWYNYNFFQNCFKLMSLDVVENQHYITKWVEDTIIRGVNHTNGTYVDDLPFLVEDTIQNGVKHTRRNGDSMNTDAEDAIQNGMNYTRWKKCKRRASVEETIENGVRHTMWSNDDDDVEDAIENGVKKIHWVQYSNLRSVEDTIQNGVKYTRLVKNKNQTFVEDTIQNGVKYTIDTTHHKNKYVEDAIKNGVKHTEYGDWLDGDERLDDIIQNGVKETKTPGEDGDIMGALDFMSDNNTNNLSHLINDVIEKGIKQTEAAALFDETKVDRIISEGVKETKGGGYLGSIEMKGKMVHQLESPKQNNEVEEVIEHGVKLTNSSLQIDGSCVVEDVIQNVIKETHDDVYHHKGRVDGVIRNGIKETWGYEKQPQKRIDEVIMNGQKD